MKLLDEEFLRKLDGVRLAIRGSVYGRQDGEKVTRDKGRAGEFVDFRPYTQGDEIRRVDWNVFGRTEQLFVKEFSREADVPLVLGIDTSASMEFGRPSKRVAAQKIAAALAYIGLNGANTLRLLTVRDRRPWISSEFRGPQSVFSCFDAMDRLSPERHASLGILAEALVTNASSKVVVVLISDLWDQEGVHETLNLLVGKGMAVSLVHLLSPEEADPPYRGLVRLQGCETGEFKRCFVADPELRQYKALLDEWRAGWARFCRERQMGYAFASSDTPIEEAVFVRLRESGILK